VDPLIGVRILGYIKKWLMELLYFISGILTVGTVYGVVLFRQIKSSHTTLLKTVQEYHDLTIADHDSLVTMYDTSTTKIEEIAEHYNTIQEEMKQDSYAGNKEINQKIVKVQNQLDTDHSIYQNLFNVADEQLKRLNSDINQLKKITKSNDNVKDAIDRY